MNHPSKAQAVESSLTQPSLFSHLAESPFALAGVLLLAVVLRLMHLTGQNLWYDEIYSLDVSQQTIGQIILTARGDMHPPLFYFFLKGWSAVWGTSVVVLRGLSVVLNLGTIAIVWNLCERLANRQVALWTTLLLAVSAHQIYYAHEIRMYSFVLFLTAGAVYGYWRWLESQLAAPQTAYRGASSAMKTGSVLSAQSSVLFSARWLALYFVCELAAVYSHYFALLMLGALSLHVLFVFWNRRGDAVFAPLRFRFLGIWCGVQALVVIGFSPWVQTFLNQSRRGQPWRTPTPLPQALFNVLSVLKDFALGYATEFDDFEQAWRSSGTSLFTLTEQTVMYTVGGTVLLTILVLSVGKTLLALRQGDEKRMLALLLFAAPLAVGVAVTLRQSLQLSRYLLIITPYLFLLIAFGLHDLPRRMRAAAFGLCVVAMMVGTLVYYRTPSRDSDLRPVLVTIQQRLQADDRIVIDPDYNDSCLVYYARQYGLEPALVKPEHAGNGEGQLQYLREHAEIRRWWVILDYHSAWFQKYDFAPALRVKSVETFSNRYPRLKLLELERPAGTP
ncbi:MAG: glycosyltransferase family 39 protein [Blastocatellia bacterium]|nr:glycosyltransferase family 39 protein [Blastocatellia bacterium]